MYKATATFLILTLCCLMSLTAQTPAVAQNDKLKLRLKANLPDYKGPSRFVGRKALITFSPDGRLVALTGTHRTITVWDTETGALKAKLKVGNESISGFAFSPDGKMAATRNFLDKSVRLWDTATWAVKTTLRGRKKNLETHFKAGVTYEQEFGPVPMAV